MFFEYATRSRLPHSTDLGDCRGDFLCDHAPTAVPATGSKHCGADGRRVGREQHLDPGCQRPDYLSGSPRGQRAPDLAERNSALHHHVVEYPKAANALSERIGTALVNGTWFVRRMQRLAG
jgi:hypothetical protein